MQGQNWPKTSITAQDWAGLVPGKHGIKDGRGSVWKVTGRKGPTTVYLLVPESDDIWDLVLYHGTILDEEEWAIIVELNQPDIEIIEL